MAKRILSPYEAWDTHIRHTPRQHPSEGIEGAELEVFLRSENADFEVVTNMPTGNYRYPAQKTTDLDSLAGLEDKGLIQFISKEEDTYYFAYTPIGIAVTQKLKGM